MASLSDLHFELGQRLAHCGFVYSEATQTKGNASVRHFDGLAIESLVRMPRPVDLPDTPDIRALQAEWDETGRLMDAAWASYGQHRNPARYKAECAEILAREAA